MSRLDFAPAEGAITRRRDVPGDAFPTEVRSAFGWTDKPSASPRPFSPLEHHQAALPRLPIPSLAHTCALYLESLRPLLDPAELDHSERCVAEFLKEGGDGERLQKMLLDFDAGSRRDAGQGPNGPRPPSWLEPFWDDSYLVGCDPIAINVNYFFAFRDDPRPLRNTQVGRAASLLRGALLCCDALRNDRWPVDRGLDMSQYPRVFGATRLPGVKRDTIVTYTTRPPEGPDALSQTSTYVPRDPDHVVVLCDDRFFAFDAFRDGALLPLPALEAALADVLRRCDTPSEGRVPVGVFTAARRDTWAREREQLITHDQENGRNLETIQSALLVVCLDSVAPANDDEFARLLLHGPGTNRWFDKHNLIVARNGRAGVTFEHAVGDGATTLRIADEMYQWSEAHGSDAPAPAEEAAVRELRWEVPDATMNALRQAYAEHKQAILANETVTLNFTRYGGAFLKSSRMSPDAIVQVAIQLAQHKMYGRPAATYEAASTRGFLHGRTETVRSCTGDALAFCRAAASRPVWGDDPSLQYDLLAKAVGAHVAYMKQAKEGLGVDRHLFGLRMMAERPGRNPSAAATAPDPVKPRLPALFEDSAYKRSSHWALSTSHCGSPSLAYFGFGPVVYDGFGIGYMIKNNEIQFVVTSKYHERLTSAGVFAAVLEESLLMVRAILLSHPALKKEPPVSMQFTHPTVVHDFQYSNEYLMYDTYDAQVFGY